MSDYPSIVLEQAVNQMASLPGVGRRTALRLVLHLLRQKDEEVEAFAGAFLLPVIMGGSLELIQEYGTDCRQGSWWDFAANTLGVLIIWLAVWPQRRRISL